MISITASNQTEGGFSPVWRLKKVDSDTEYSQAVRLPPRLPQQPQLRCTANWDHLTAFVQNVLCRRARVGRWCSSLSEPQIKCCWCAFLQLYDAYCVSRHTYTSSAPHQVTRNSVQTESCFTAKFPVTAINHLPPNLNFINQPYRMFKDESSCSILTGASWSRSACNHGVEVPPQVRHVPVSPVSAVSDVNPGVSALFNIINNGLKHNWW